MLIDIAYFLVGAGIGAASMNLASTWRRSTTLLPAVQPAVALVIDMLAAQIGWHSDNYRGWHETGATIWTANEDYGLRFWPILAHPQAEGLPSVSGEGLKLNSASRRALHKAAKRFREERAFGAIEDQVAEFARRSQAYAVERSHLPSRPSR